ncbi:30S ribosomal protein S9 [Candidatus Portiera aleyrodidarum]|uniref:Small ribosomal subunit protein uS9 n=1 Tax=Candidatus Portiera aleyrodidarum TaxID=91844 RepID=A0A8D9JSR8_9GAMM|nr:30S ribosomal protein S9 [Candidatus Portiera aleyrodidarum]CEI58793.1 30S ribosomal protein S9 [Candidatus Portiera aleyrodidarum]
MYYYGTGRRKTAVARVFIKLGKGKILINKNKLNDYFNKYMHFIVLEPLEITNNVNTFNIKITVRGGGYKAQAEAIRHGLARALLAFNVKFRYNLRKNGYLMRDSRKVERKKIGLRKSRKSPQFSKR